MRRQCSACGLVTTNPLVRIHRVYDPRQPNGARICGYFEEAPEERPEERLMEREEREPQENT